MEKQEVLAEISRLAAGGNLTESEVLRAFNAQGMEPGDSGVFTKHITPVQILYYFGGIVAFIGVTILLAQNWDYFSDMAKILFTAVMGVVLLASGIYLAKVEKLAGVGQSFMLAGSLIFPVGIYVILKIADIDIEDLGVQSSATAGIAAIFLLCYWQFRKILLLFFGIAWTTIFYFILGSYLFQDSISLFPNYFWYRLLIAGLSYMLIDYYFSQSDSGFKRLHGLLNGFGIMGFLGAAFALSLDDSLWIWEAIFPILALGTMLVSVKFRSRMFLITGTLGLIGYIFHITSKYFAESAGWPVALIVAGFALIGIGYFAVQVNNKYFGVRARRQS